MQLTITLRREVADEDSGEVIFQLVKTKLADHPEIKITGSVQKNMPEDE